MRLGPISLLLLYPCAALGQMAHSEAPAARPATLMAGQAPVHHPITTSSLEAQKFFDQGLGLLYSFNHEEAIRSFARAAELDPKAPMPLWGIALALGMNINDPAPEAARLKQARELI